MSLNFNDLYDALNVTAITDLIGTYESTPAIFSDSRVPADYTSVDATINYYLATPFDARTDWQIDTWTVNCRAQTSRLSRDLANAVLDEINRNNYSDYFINCQLLPEIGPADETDNYNNIVEATVKKR